MTSKFLPQPPAQRPPGADPTPRSSDLGHGHRHPPPHPCPQEEISAGTPPTRQPRSAGQLRRGVLGPLCACSKPRPAVEVGFVWWLVQACAAVNAGCQGSWPAPPWATPARPAPAAATPPHPIHDTISPGSKEGGKIWEPIAQQGPQALLSLPEATQPSPFFHVGHPPAPAALDVVESRVLVIPTSCPVPGRECGARPRDQERAERSNKGQKSKEQNHLSAPGLRSFAPPAPGRSLGPGPPRTPPPPTPAHPLSARPAWGCGQTGSLPPVSLRPCVLLGGGPGGLCPPPPIPPPSPASPCVFRQLSTCESCTYYWFWVVSSVFFLIK